MSKMQEKTNKAFTEVVFILDRSGSMSGLESDVIGSFNSTLKEQQEISQDIRLSTVLFDNKVEYLHAHKPVNKVKPITAKDYYVRGCTALIDALGTAIDDMIDRQKNPETRAQKVLFIVNTDGYENASQDYTAREVKRMLELQQKVYGWEFLFLGANIDSVETATQYGFKEERVSNYVNDTKGNQAKRKSESRAILSYAQEGRICEDALEPARADYAKRAR